MSRRSEMAREYRQNVVAQDEEAWPSVDDERDWQESLAALEPAEDDPPRVVTVEHGYGLPAYPDGGDPWGEVEDPKVSLVKQRWLTELLGNPGWWKHNYLTCECDACQRCRNGIAGVSAT